jgi:hypothetical protein
LILEIIVFRYGAFDMNCAIGRLLAFAYLERFENGKFKLELNSEFTGKGKAIPVTCCGGP